MGWESNPSYSLFRKIKDVKRPSLLKFNLVGHIYIDDSCVSAALTTELSEEQVLPTLGLEPRTRRLGVNESPSVPTLKYLY